MICLWFEQIALKKQAICSKKNIYPTVCLWLFFTVFPPFYAQEPSAPVALRSVALYKDWLTLVALYKRATVSNLLPVMGGIHSFPQVNQSFAHKKRAIRLKNRWANSQPWIFVNGLWVFYGFYHWAMVNSSPGIHLAQGQSLSQAYWPGSQSAPGPGSQSYPG